MICTARARPRASAPAPSWSSGSATRCTASSASAGGAAKLFIGDAREPETSQTRATNARLIQELDLTWDTFQRTVFARQKDVAALDPGATAEARKRHVERLLGLERFRLAAEKARGRAKDLESELRGLREQAPDVAALRVDLQAAADAAAASDPAVRAAEQRRDALRGEIDGVEAAVETERERSERHRELAREQTRLTTTLAADQAELTARKERLERHDGHVARLAVLERRDDDLEALSVARSRWDQLAESRAELETAVAAFERLTFDAAGAGARADELNALRAEQDALTDTPAPDVRGFGDRVTALEAAEGVPSETDARSAFARVEDARDDARGRRLAAREAIARDAAHLAEIEQGGAGTECPACLRAYGDDLPRILARHRERLTAARQDADALDAECARLDTEHATARGLHGRAEQAERLLAQTSGADDLETARAAHERAVAGERGRTARLSELRTAIGTLGPQVAEEARAEREHAALAAVVDGHRERVSRAAAALGVDGYSAPRHEAAIKAHDAADEARRERASLRAAIEAAHDLPGEVARLEDRLGESTARLAEIADELEQLAFETERLPELRERLRVARGDHEQAVEAVHAARILATQRDGLVRELTARVADAETAQALILERERALREHQVAGGLLSDFRSHQNLRAWPRLEEGASALLSEATDGRYADVRLSEDYKLMIYDRGEPYGLERFSGGEQDLANLCLRLAIADWVARERNVEVGFVILDEVFGSQDEERRRRLMGELRSLGNRFHQLLVITHVPEIADLCEHQLEVTLIEPGRSAAAFR